MRNLLKGLRYGWFGLKTVLGLDPKGYFIPYRYYKADPRDSYSAVQDLFKRSHPHFLAELTRLKTYEDSYDTALGMQGWFPGLDAAYLYAFIRDTKPNKILEIGSGHSTHVMQKAVADGNLSTQIICIDPAPRCKLEKTSITWMPYLLSLDHLSLADSLGAGDILFIDSSHILMPGTDVDLLFNHFLPRLSSGVFVHIHDIFLPNPYPKSWGWRGYNEQSLVATLLLNGTGYTPHFSSAVMAEISTIPCPPQTFQNSLWICKQ